MHSEMMSKNMTQVCVKFMIYHIVIDIWESIGMVKFYAGLKMEGLLRGCCCHSFDYYI